MTECLMINSQDILPQTKVVSNLLSKDFREFVSLFPFNYIAWHVLSNPCGGMSVNKIYNDFNYFLVLSFLSSINHIVALQVNMELYLLSIGMY